MEDSHASSSIHRDGNGDKNDAGEKRSALPAEAEQLFSLIAKRRSMRFGAGFEMAGGSENPLAFKSDLSPAPLTLAEEAFIAMSAVAVTGFVNAELPLHDGADGKGGVLSTLVGRAVASADTVHAAALLVINDDGVYYVKRPQELSTAEISELVRLSEEGSVVELYRRMRVKISDLRPRVPRDDPRHTPTYNRWDHNQPGSTIFLPVIDTSALWFAGVLSPLENGFNIADEHANYALAGTQSLTTQRGGHLESDLGTGKVFPISKVEQLLDRLALQEAGQILAHLQLAAAALRSDGVGAFPVAMASPEWFTALGFDHAHVPLSKLPGLRGVKRAAAALSKQSLPVPTALLAGGMPLMTPFLPEHYPSAAGRPSMEGAVNAYLDARFGSGGALRNDQGPWKYNHAVKQYMKRPDERTVSTVVAAASYIYDTYGRFPRDIDPISTVTGVQAHRIDPEFYRRFYRQ